MNQLRNDNGQDVVAEGAPGSIARMRCAYPCLLDRINTLYYRTAGAPGHAVDEAILLIREAGIRDERDTATLLQASAYRNEIGRGSIMDLVLSLDN